MKATIFYFTRLIVKCVSAFVMMLALSIAVMIAAVVLDKCGVSVFRQHINLTCSVAMLVGLIFGWKFPNRFWGVKTFRKIPPSEFSSSRDETYDWFDLNLPKYGDFDPDQHVYGRIGGTMDSGVFSEGNTHAGMQGELKLSELIDRVNSEIGGHAYVFRGLHWPGSDDADIDFVVAMTREGHHRLYTDLWLVDAKMWKRGDYFWDGEMCHVKTPGESMLPYHEIKFGNAVRSVKDVVPKTFVHANVVIFNATSCKNSFDQGMTILTPEDFERQLRTHLMASSSWAVPLPMSVGERLAGLVKVPL